MYLDWAINTTSPIYAWWLDAAMKDRMKAPMGRTKCRRNSDSLLCCYCTNLPRNFLRRNPTTCNNLVLVLELSSAQAWAVDLALVLALESSLALV